VKGLVTGLVAAVVATGCARAPAPPAAREVLPFIADDYPRALAEARSRALPLFVECWTLW
jgi:hypothetical protein